MKKYLSLFVAPIEAYDKMKEAMKDKTPEEQGKEMEAWKQWMEQHKADIVDTGAPVGKAVRVTGDGTVSETRNTIGGYMIIQAENAEAAAAIYKDSPHFGMEEGAIELMEIVEM